MSRTSEFLSAMAAPRSRARSLGLAGLFALAGSVAKADQIIPPGAAAFDGKVMHVAPGDTLLLPVGERGPLKLSHLVGTADHPIVIKPVAGGRVLIRGQGTDYGIKALACSHIRLTGESGSLEVSGGTLGVQFGGGSTDFEIDHLEIHDIKFAGLVVKTDPTSDPATQRGQFTLRNANIHDNLIHDTDAEGMYIGSSFYDTGEKHGDVVLLPSALVGLHVEHNRVFRTDADGIQVGSASEDCIIADNVIENYGCKPFGPFQNSGLQINPGTQAAILRNRIVDGSGTGITLLGFGGTRVEDNIIIRAGEAGIYCREAPPAANGEGVVFLRNIIVAPHTDGVILQSHPTKSSHVLRHNRIVAPGSGRFLVPSDSSDSILEDNAFVPTESETVDQTR